MSVKIAGREGKRKSTICRPLMPTMKSYHGSSRIEVLVFRSTWKPHSLLLGLVLDWGPSASRRDMKRLRAPNMLILAILILYLCLEL